MLNRIKLYYQLLKLRWTIGRQAARTVRHYREGDIEEGDRILVRDDKETGLTHVYRVPRSGIGKTDMVQAGKSVDSPYPPDADLRLRFTDNLVIPLGQPAAPFLLREYRNGTLAVDLSIHYRAVEPEEDDILCGTVTVDSRDHGAVSGKVYISPHFIFDTAEDSDRNQFLSGMNGEMGRMLREGKALGPLRMYDDSGYCREITVGGMLLDLPSCHFSPECSLVLSGDSLIAVVHGAYDSEGNEVPGFCLLLDKERFLLHSNARYSEEDGMWMMDFPPEPVHFESDPGE